MVNAENKNKNQTSFSWKTSKKNTVVNDRQTCKVLFSHIKCFSFPMERQSKNLLWYGWSQWSGYSINDFKQRKTTWISMHSILLSKFFSKNSLSITILNGRRWPICVRICGKHEITILFSDFPISLKLKAMLTKIGCDFLQNPSSYIRMVQFGLTIWETIFKILKQRKQTMLFRLNQ